MTIISTAHQEVLRELHDNARGHAEASDGFFTIDPFNPKKVEPFLTLYSHGDTANRRAWAVHREADILEATAKLVDSRYGSLPNPKEIGGRSGLALDNMSTEIKAGNDIALGLKHGETRDIAFNLGFISIGLSRRDAPHRTGLVLSKGIDFLRIDTRSFGFPNQAVDEFLNGIGLQARADRTVAVRDFVGVVADYTYFVIPSSQSFSGLREKQGNVIKKFNRSTLGLIDDDFSATAHGAYPLLLGSAVTGTLEKPLDIERFTEGLLIDGNFETYPEAQTLTPELVRVIGEISPGLLASIANRRTYASGITLRSDSASSVDINPRYIYPTCEQDLITLGKLVIDVSGELDPVHQFVQDLRGNLPVVRRSPK